MISDRSQTINTQPPLRGTLEQRCQALGEAALQQILEIARAESGIQGQLRATGIFLSGLDSTEPWPSPAPEFSPPAR